MPFSSKVLEDSIRLAKIRRIKMALYIVQAIMLVALALLIIFVMGDAQVTPVLYLPLDSFAAILVLLILVVCVESYFFRIMEIRFARSSSARHLMAKNSMRTAIIVAIIAGFVTVMLVTPPALNAIQDVSSQTLTISADDAAVFWSRDPLALQRMVEVRATSVNTVEVYLVDGDLYEAYNGSISDMFVLRINRDNYVVEDALAFEIPRADHRKYAVVLNDLENPGSAATITIVREVSEIFTSVVSLLTIAMVVASVAWVAYLMPIERKYSRGSIYK